MGTDRRGMRGLGLPVAGGDGTVARVDVRNALDRLGKRAVILDVTQTAVPFEALCGFRAPAESAARPAE